VGKRELEVLGQELLDVGAADVHGLFNFDNLEDLFTRCISIGIGLRRGALTWIDLNRARWRAAMSW